VDAYRAVITEAPTDSAALGIQREIIDIYQNRVLDPERAQEARLQLVENFGPSSDWARANAGAVAEANAAREEALRQSAQYRLSQAQQRNDRARYAEAAQLYARYMQEFAQADSAQRVSLLYGEALFGQANYAGAGAQYAHAAYGFPQRDTALAQRSSATRTTVRRRIPCSPPSIATSRPSRKPSSPSAPSSRRESEPRNRSGGM
jgi:lipopolysaccharide biosynthesis regulator YciM